MSAAPLLAALPSDLVLTLVDVGSAGGLNPRWNPYRSILSSVLFDPREEAAAGEFGRGQTRVYPVALGEQSGKAPLHLTAMANMSSFLEPDPEVMARYGKKRGDSAVVATEQVQIERLDSLAEQDGFRPDVLKVDTQGSELMVLNGAEQALYSVLLAEIEVSFFRRYRDQPLFADIEAHMAKRGFELIELQKLKRYRASNRLNIRNAGVGKGDHSGRVTYGDAIFLRREESILSASKSDGGASLMRAVVALAAYGKADIAARLLDQGHESLAEQRGKAIGRGLIGLGQRQFGFLARLLGKG